MEVNSILHYIRFIKKERVREREREGERESKRKGRERGILRNQSYSAGV